MLLGVSDIHLLPAQFALVDGCFDPLHRGHIEYFQLARSLGLPLLCNLASDAYILARKGRPPLLPQRDRLQVVDAIRHIDFTCLAEHSTAWSLRHFRPRCYVKGADWRDRLPAEEVRICGELGIEIVYVDCPRDSSTRILQAFLEQAHVHRAA
jgi:glycerol-3-phosphate cytidylyltransferase